MERDNIISFENLCRIFEMRIKLDKEKNTKTPIDVLDNYEKYSKKIDAIYNSDFQKELKSVISPAITLEKEETRLKKLISLLEERLEKRVELEDRFYNSTGSYITGLQMIVSPDELNDKKERLSIVSKYLETSTEIESLTGSINKLKDSLQTEETKKEEYTAKNKIMEDELYSSFITVIKNDDYYKDISEEDINSELEEVKLKVNETQETYDITKESVGSLVSSGLTDDYTSYIEEAEKNYFAYKNRELVLKIYKLVIDFEEEFNAIYAKREKVEELLEEKKTLSSEFSTNTSDELLSFEKTLLIQINYLNEEKEVLENISNYTSRIKFKEERLEELKESNNSIETLTILREYGLIDTYDSDDVTDEESSEGEELVIRELSKIELPELEEPIVKEVYNPYRITEVKDYPRTLNIGLAKLKGESVRDKVNKKLNPKEVPSFEEMLKDFGKEEPKEETSSDNVVNSHESVLDEDVMSPSNSDNLEEPQKQVDMSPVWEIPTEVETSPSKVDVPLVWEAPTEREETPSKVEEPLPEQILPVWESINPIDTLTEDNNINNIDITSVPLEVASVVQEDTNMFWVPVSDSKLETNHLPNINIRVNDTLNGNDNFGFPTINN